MIRQALAFPIRGQVKGVKPPTIRPPEAPGAPPAPGPRAAPTTEDLYAEHWQYVLDLVSSYGIDTNDQHDVAQTVWQNVHARIASYDPDQHETPRAWLAGFVRRCAANQRRTTRRKPEVLSAEPAALSRARGLDPEEWEIVQTALWKAIRNDERREAFVLHIRFGLTIAEIAMATGVLETTVSFRLRMAKHDLKADSAEKSTRADAFLGFGTLEALTEAIRPKPRPFEEGAELWNRIAEQIRREEEEADAGRDRSPSSPAPAVPALPALVPSAPASKAVVMLTKTKLAALVAGVFASGIATGAGGLLAWQAHDAARSRREAHALEARPMEPSPMPTQAAPEPAPSSLAAARPAAGSSTAARPAPDGAAAAMADDSQRLILRMQRAAQTASFATVLDLADEHARRFSGEQVRERETQRIEALIRLGRSSEAEAHARAVVAQYPQHRSAMERAIGHSLP
jgi:RNA polymerase sigma factor (sigma-70 family)